MKLHKKVSLFLALIIITSAITCNVSAVSYDNLQPCYVFDHHYNFYTKTNNLEKRANCYGYAMRLFFSGDDVTEYKQQPGEFAYKTSGNNFDSLVAYYNTAIYNGTFDPSTVYSRIILDCIQLGYTLNLLSTDLKTKPPLAPSPANKRLVLLVTSRSDYHFYIQHSKATTINGITTNYWTHKFGTTPAATNCIISDHASTVLTNENILDHVNCNGYTSAVYAFYVTAPGAVDTNHYYGHGGDDTITPIKSTDCAGTNLLTAEAHSYLRSPSYINGHIDFIGDTDFHVFDVELTGNYTFYISKQTGMDLYIDDGAVTSNNTATGSKTTTIGKNAINKTLTRTLTKGTKYYFSIFSTHTSFPLSNNHYSIEIRYIGS